MTARRPRVVVIGGGFAGLNAAKELRRAPVEVVLIDRRNHHLFQPLLYQVATAALSPADIASPIRGILRRQENLEVIMADAQAIDARKREVVFSDGFRLGYDYLVLASGAVDQYFGHPEWASAAPGLKTIDDATEIRRRFLLAFEAAEREADPTEQRRLLTAVVIGGGPTGVEMAGAMAEMSRHSLPRDFRRIDPATARVLLVEGGERILPAFPADLSRKAVRALEDRGVEVRTGRLVTAIEKGAVYLGEERIDAGIVVWAAGVAASPLGATIGAETDRSGRVRVLPDLSVPNHPEIFVIGDLAHALDLDGTPLPGLAPVAIQQGHATGRNIERRLRGLPGIPFRYTDKGTMATIGRGAAIAVIGTMHLSGFLAWLAWLFIHLLFLIGFRNRVAVMMEWAWSYLTWQRGARLITGAVSEDLEPVPGPETHSDPPPARATIPPDDPDDLPS